MPNFRNNKKIIREWFQSETWTKETPLPPEMEHASQMEKINALFACLPQSGKITDRAAYAIGKCMSILFVENKEQAQICMRRFIWHMNEESGNIGWGIPQAFSQSLAQCAGLAKLYHNILISYIYDLDGDNNYCDHAPLRVYCYEAVMTLGLALPEYQDKILYVVQNAKEEDFACLQMIEKIVKSFSEESLTV